MELSPPGSLLWPWCTQRMSRRWGGPVLSEESGFGSLEAVDSWLPAFAANVVMSLPVTVLPELSSNSRGFWILSISREIMVTEILKVNECDEHTRDGRRSFTRLKSYCRTLWKLASGVFRPTTRALNRNAYRSQLKYMIVVINKSFVTDFV